ncbi:MAG: ATPase [Candidatus Andeanibacterium colombiense]|uniref:ATPase n=1 Tax=Candidatus Andeanibacterium colombiense TaxID=3121345 RepID=A0AAJ6BNC5_9SPHN|nr:MAG: ATPase [Sphingomonadaceae bacterium]
MNGASQIAAVGPGETSAAPHGQTAEAVPEPAFELEETYAEEERERRNFGWIVPMLAVLAILGWTVFFGFAHQTLLRTGITPGEASELIEKWAVPVLLVIGLWLLAMRSSRREVVRFDRVARTLNDESALLETRLVTVNRELSLAREFLAAQSRDLESLGRVASERLSENAERMSAMIHANGAQIDAIASVSATALENMDKLRGELPVVANSARDVASQIGNAGRTAHGQLEELVSGFHRLNTFGEASKRQVEALRTRLDTAMTELDAHSARLGETEERALAGLYERLNALHRESESFAATLETGRGEALHKWETAICGLRERLTQALDEVSEIDAAALERSRARLLALRDEAVEVDQAMTGQVDSFLAGVEQRRSAHHAQMAEIGETLDARLASLQQIDEALQSLAANGTHVGGELSQAIDQLAAKLATNKNVLDATDAAVYSLTHSSVRLLELIQAGSQHSREQLPAAIAAAENRLGEFEARSLTLGTMLNEAAEKGATLAGHVAAAEAGSAAAIERIETLHASLGAQDAAHAERIETMRSSLAALGQESAALSERVGERLTEAVDRLRGALREALDRLGSDDGETLDALAARIGKQSAEAIERAIHLSASEAIGELEQGAAHASGVGREAARQLRDQLAKVNELAGNLESRVARARERAEEQVDGDFARRVALITESLNSNSIDIAKALSNDVTDTAWASYLRGDRGIFTRRAVRLLDNSEAREVAEIYDRDHDFREHVSRYIHDFEGMLRTMLSTRDGHALGVTLLSSDMGKLYVALAQAIERLRS